MGRAPYTRNSRLTVAMVKHRMLLELEDVWATEAERWEDFLDESFYTASELGR